MELISIKEGEKESLRDYVGCFNSDAVTSQALARGCRISADDRIEGRHCLKELLGLKGVDLLNENPR